MSMCWLYPRIFFSNNSLDLLSGSIITKLHSTGYGWTHVTFQAVQLIMLCLPCSISWFKHRIYVCCFNFNSLRPRQNDRHFADDIFKCIFLNENLWISLKISLKFVPKVPINNIQALVQIMAWRRPGDKPLSEPMIVSLLTHTCVTRP